VTRVYELSKDTTRGKKAKRSYFVVYRDIQRV